MSLSAFPIALIAHLLSQMQVDIRLTHASVKSLSLDRIEVVNLSNGSTSIFPVGAVAGGPLTEDGVTRSFDKELQSIDYKVSMS